MVSVVSIDPQSAARNVQCNVVMSGGVIKMRGVVSP
jgi:hypothetical protein